MGCVSVAEEDISHPVLNRFDLAPRAFIYFCCLKGGHLFGTGHLAEWRRLLTKTHKRHSQKWGGGGGGRYSKGRIITVITVLEAILTGRY